MNPYRGVLKALDRAGITYVPVHADDIVAGRFGVLVLPNVAAMSDEQVALVKTFATNGGSVIAISETSLFGEFGEPRGDFALGDLFGVHRLAGSRGSWEAADINIEVFVRHSYLRLAPELRAGVDGPKDITAPAAGGTRHPVLSGLERADTIPFGGFLPIARVDAGVDVLATFIPEFPIYPPETSWMREPRTDLPAIAVRETDAGAKLVWLVADLDRCFARDENGEHGMLIANAVRWALGARSLLSIAGGHGCISPSLYRQGKRQILHLNNRILTSRIPGRMTELIPIGPVQVRLRAAADAVPPCRGSRSAAIHLEESIARTTGTRGPTRAAGASLRRSTARSISA